MTSETQPQVSPTTRRGWQALAVLVPLLASVAVAVALARPLKPCDGQCDIVDRIDAELDRAAPPQVIVLGNSSARHAVDPERLATGLGVDPARIALLGTPSATPGTWYAMAKYRVFDRGLRPAHVLVLAPAGAFWVTRPDDGPDLDTQLALAGTDDPVILSVGGIEGGPARWWYRADLRLGLLRETLLQASLGNGAALASWWRDPLASEFVVDIADREDVRFEGAKAEGLVLASTVEASFVPALVALAHEHGARITFAHIPARTRGHGGFAEERPEADALLATWLAEHGSAYHALADLALPPAAYEDRFHLRPAGAARYTEALLHAMGAPP